VRVCQLRGRGEGRQLGNLERGMREGKRTHSCSQSSLVLTLNVPMSASECPPKYLVPLSARGVRESQRGLDEELSRKEETSGRITMSAPHLNGSCSGGGAKVESMARMAPAACAFLASATREGVSEVPLGRVDERKADAQAPIERDSPVGLSGVSSQTRTFLSVGYSSSRWMMLCRTRSSRSAKSPFGKGEAGARDCDAQPGPLLALCGTPRATCGSRGSPRRA